MVDLSMITNNKELLKVIYALVVVAICIVIVLRTDKLYRISSHRGIQYFRNAFFFYGIGFFIRFFIGSGFFYDMGLVRYSLIVKFLFELFLIMAGFFLVYSLLWKKFEMKGGDDYRSSLLNSKISIFYIMAILIAVLDYLWVTNAFMFISQIVLFLFASIITLVNCARGGREHKFLNLYFIAILLTFAAWSLNAASWFLNWNQALLINVYILNTIVFLMFLFGVMIVTKPSR